MSVLVVAAVLRRGSEVFLVRQQGPHDPTPCWALPGGRVEHGEALSEAVKREVLEETGLRVARLGALRCVSRALDTVSSSDYVAFTFAVEEWSGEPQPADPDGFVTECAFFEAEVAVELLSALPWRSMREPGMAAVRPAAGSAQFFEYDGL